MSDLHLVLLTLIQQRPTSYVEGEPVACPSCGEPSKPYSESSTLVGGDRNHFWKYHSCSKCSYKFVQEHKRDKQWVTVKTESGQKVLSGVSTCFENYVYTCRHCGGDVVRKYKNLDGSPHTSGVLSASKSPDGTWKNNYRTSYQCQACRLEVDID